MNDKLLNRCHQRITYRENSRAALPPPFFFQIVHAKFILGEQRGIRAIEGIVAFVFLSLQGVCRGCGKSLDGFFVALPLQLQRNGVKNDGEDDRDQCEQQQYASI